MAAEFHDLAIKDVKRQTENSVAIAFRVPDELKDIFSFSPGQYLTLRADIDGRDTRRSYSICSSPGQDLTVGIKQVEGGKFSSFAQLLKPGAKLQVMPPQGRFVCEPDGRARRQFLLIAAGSGITPILSIAGSILEKEPLSSVTLVYGNRQSSSIMFRHELEDLKDRFIQRFHMYHVLSQEARDVELFQGRIDENRICAMTTAGIINPVSCDGVYICGPYAMAEEIKNCLIQSGVSDSKVHVELFDVPEDDKPTTIPIETKKAIEEGVRVEFILDGLTRSFAITDVKDTVLNGAEKSGYDLPFSCAGGMCATCRCKVIEGEAVMDKNFSLDDWELEAGFVLACQSRPKSEKLVLDFDAT